MKALLLLPIFLTACGTTLTLGLSYKGVTASITSAPKPPPVIISPEPPLPDSPSGKEPVSILLP